MPPRQAIRPEQMSTPPTVRSIGRAVSPPPSVSSPPTEPLLGPALRSPLVLLQRRTRTHQRNTDCKMSPQGYQTKIESLLTPPPPQKLRDQILVPPAVPAWQSF